MIHRLQRTISTILAMILAVSCSNRYVAAPSFDGERAFEYLKRQVEFGPRVPGTDAWWSCRNFFQEHFTGLGIDVEYQTFDFIDPYSRERIPLVNVIASINGSIPNADRILLMAHWDSRPRTDYPTSPELANEPISGANDGASGVAVLLELADMLTEHPQENTVDIVLVDGEDWGKSGDNDYYLLGSREFARRDIRNKYRFGIVIDMVGDADLQLYREVFSERYFPELNDMIWSVAQELGVSGFYDSTKHTVLDDHVSLITAGIPAVVIIDFDYQYWHTDQDVAKHCSAESLANVGRVLAHIIYNPQLWPKKK